MKTTRANPGKKRKHHEKNGREMCKQVGEVGRNGKELL
jgi:hypothetical protein